MVSYYGNWTYNDLIQTYDLPEKRSILNKSPKYQSDSIMGFLTKDSRYSIFVYMIKLAQLDLRMDQEQFKSTLFVCDDYTLLQTYPEEFFMNLDRNTALTIINFNIIPRLVTHNSLNSITLAKLDTKNPRSEIILFKKNGQIILNGQAKLIEEYQQSNGVIQVIDGLLLPENFVNLC
jgi:uncharacterized surface protein with fasciclin (FAS1) repeats